MDNMIYTKINLFASLVLVTALSVTYYSVSSDSEWQNNSPYEIQSFEIHRSENTGVFQRDSPPSISNNEVKSKAKELFLHQMNCHQETCSRCDCYTKVVSDEIDSKTTSEQYSAVWDRVIENSKSCEQLSSAWQIKVPDHTSKVLLGTLAWLIFSTAIITMHLLVEYSHDSLDAAGKPKHPDWRYFSFVSLLLIFIIGLGCILIYNEEGMNSYWFVLFVGLLSLHVLMRLFIRISIMYFRQETTADKKMMLAEFAKKQVMGSMTTFAIVAAARLTQLFSGSNNAEYAMNIVAVSLFVGGCSVTLRLICASISMIDTAKSESKKADRPALVFAGQWVWALSIILGIMLISTIPLNSGGGLVEGSIIFKFSLGLLVTSLVLQYPCLLDNRHQWMALQTLEFMARLIAFGTCVVYCSTG